VIIVAVNAVSGALIPSTGIQVSWRQPATRNEIRMKK
jgi:hypothetical protein